MTPPNDLPLVEICAIIILVQVYCLNAARRNRLVAVRRSAHGFTYLQMHDRNTLLRRYTSLSFWSRPNYVGPHCAAPAPSRAISSAVHRDSQRFTPRPASIRVPISRGDAQRPYRLIRPHHVCPEPNRFRRFIGIGHIAIPAFRSPNVSWAPGVTSGLQDVLLLDGGIRRP